MTPYMKPSRLERLRAFRPPSRYGYHRLWFHLVLAAATLALPAPAWAEWTLGAFLGASATRDAFLEITQPADQTRLRIEPVSFRSASFEPPLYYGYRVGLFPRSGRIGIEGEFIHLKVIADTERQAEAEGLLRGAAATGWLPVNAVLDRFSLTHGANLLLVNAVYRHRAPARVMEAAPRWVLIARVGAGTSIPHAESATSDTSAAQYEWTGLSIQAAGGASLRLLDRLYVTGEYKLTRVAPEVTIVRGSASTSLITHHMVFGVTLHVGGKNHLHPH